MATKKAGCYLVDTQTKMVALIYRDYHNDYSFPKGHVEVGEDLKTTAIRETAEETKRVAVIVEDIEPTIERYVTPKGEKCECYMFVAIDAGKSDNDSTDTHDVVWTPFEDVREKLSYEGLKTQWDKVFIKIKNLLK